MASNLNLDFSSALGGTVLDKDGEGTGFTSVQANAANNAYDLGRIDLNTSASSLVLTATQGSIASTNSLKNGLQLPLDSASEWFTVSTRLKGPFNNLTSPVQQGGIFVGSDQNNYVKLVIVNSGASGLGLQFYQEQNGQNSSVGGGSGAQVAALDGAGINTLDLFLTGNPAVGHISAAYRINSDTAAPTVLPDVFAPNPTTLFFADATTARTGILAFTKDAADVPVTFDNFGILYPYQTTGSTGGNIQVDTPDANIVPNRMVFSTFNQEVRPAKTFSLNNTSTEVVTITGLTFGNSREKVNPALGDAAYQRAADFQLVNAPTQPFTLQPGEVRKLSVRFVPLLTPSVVSSKTHFLNGENYASLTITSQAANQSTTEVDRVNLAGLNAPGVEGRNEPGVAEIARVLGLGVDIGTEKTQLGSDKSPVGGEVYSPYWLRADTTKPVEIHPLAVYRSPGGNPRGKVSLVYKNGGGSGVLYQFAGKTNDNNTPGSDDVSGGENQKLLPNILVSQNGKLVNVAPTADLVDFNPTSAFAVSVDNSSIDYTKNGKEMPQTWRMYAVRNAEGNLIPNTWYAVHDFGNTLQGKNFDYNDHVFLLKNARPQAAPDSLEDANRAALYRLDVGGSSNYTDRYGNVWTPDTGYFTPAKTPIDIGGRDPNTPAPAINNTRNDTLYQTYRALLPGGQSTPIAQRILKYALPVAPGAVDLRLHFAELYYGVADGQTSGVDKRIFDIKIEGTTVRDNFDISKEAQAGLTALVLPLNGIQVSDGILNIEFKAEKNFGSIAAIQVFRSPV